MVSHPFEICAKDHCSGLPGVLSDLSLPEESAGANCWLAPILGHELTTRAELMHDQADHPAGEEYGSALLLLN